MVRLSEQRHPTVDRFGHLLRPYETRSPAGPERFLAMVISLILVALVMAGCSSWPAKASPAEGFPGSRSAHSTRDDLEASSSGPLSVVEVDPATAIRFEHLGVENGLSDSNVYCALQDDVGFIWFGTGDGLNRYDGYSFTVFRHDPTDPESLSANQISSLYQDQTGTLWIGTEGTGLNAYLIREDRFVHYLYDPVHQSLSSNMVTAVVGDYSGRLWIGTWGGGLNRFRPEKAEFIHHRQSPGRLSSDRIYALHLDRSRFLWIGTDEGLDRLDVAAGQFAHYDIRGSDEDRKLAVRAIVADPSGELWLGTDGGGLFQFDPGDGSRSQFLIDPEDIEGYAYNDIVSLLLDRTQTLWVGTNGGGLYAFDREKGSFVRHATDPRNSYSMSSNYIEMIYQDQQDILWIGTLGGGINKYDRSSRGFTHYQNNPNDPNSLSHDRVLSVLEDRIGVLWIGTDGKGLDRFDRQTGEFTHFESKAGEPNSPSSNYISSLCEDRLGYLWLGTWGAGLDRFDTDTGEFVHFQPEPDDPDSLSHAVIWPILEDRSGRLWIGTWGGGLNVLNRETGRFTHYRHDGEDPSTLLSDIVTSIFEDSTGTLWIGTQGGLHRYSNETDDLVRYPAEQSAGVEADANDGLGAVTAIRQDNTGVIWVANSLRGVARLDMEAAHFDYLTEDDGLPSNRVASIEIDDRGYLWISTAKGLAKLDPSTERVWTYSQSDGLQGYQFTFGCSDKGEDGKLIFGGTTGLDLVEPSAIHENQFVPPVVLTRLTQGGRAITPGSTVDQLDEIRLRWPSNYFEFEFAALNFVQPGKNQYAYRLDGFDDNWVFTGNRRFGQYTNLPGGQYTLRITGSNNDQLWNDVGAVIEITVVPPFWEAWWFLGSLGLVAAGAAVLGYRLRVRTIQSRSRELETLVKDRTAELRQRSHQLQERTAELEERNLEVEQRRQELEALYRADTELDRCLHLDDVLRTLVNIAIEMLQADKSSFYVWDSSHEKLVIGMARGYQSASLARLSFDPGEGTVGYVAASGQPLVVKDARLDWRISRPDTIDAEGIRSFMQVPIRVGGQMFGVFSADYVQPRAFGEEEQRLFLALAQRAGLAIETVERYEQSQQLAVVEERSRLARELHDAVTQTLFSASLISEALPGALQRNTDEAKVLLQELRQLTRGALAEMRTLLLELRPAALVEANLVELLRQLGEAVTGREGMEVEVVADGSAHLQPDVHVVFYRIAQEALNNVVKHARANQVSILLSCGSESKDGETVAAKLTIRDDGRGFDPGCPTADCLGLRIMRERAESIRADLTIESSPGEGTEIRLDWQHGRREPA